MIDYSGFEAAYGQFKGNRTEMARWLGCSRGTVFNWCKAHESGQPKTTKVAKRKAEAPEELREVRSLERKLERAKADLKQEKKRREIAESDLKGLESSSEILKDLGSRQIHRNKVKPKSGAKAHGSASAIICATDWHLEKRVVGSTVSNLNEFDLDVAEKRIGNLWRKSIFLAETWSQIGIINEYVLWLGGDLIQNYLHPEDNETNTLGPTEAIALLQDHLVTGITHLLENIPDGAKLKVVCNVGNHSRTTRYMQHGTSWKHSWEWLAYITLSRMFPQVEFVIAQGYFNYVDVQGYNVRFMHGDAVKYNGGVGGLQIPMSKAIAAWDKAKRADYTFSGHYHTYQSHWAWESVGCLCGYDSFALSIKADYQPPTQTFVVIDKERGKVCSLPIFLD